MESPGRCDLVANATKCASLRPVNEHPRPRPPAPKPRSATESERLRALVQTFVRRFGLLVTKETPCGQPVSPSYAHALMVLLERERQKDETTQAELGARLGIDKSNVTRLCGRLEALGHGTQARAPGDGRSRIVTLTPAGQRLALRIEAASAARFGQVVAAVPREKRAMLFESLALLNQALASLSGTAELT